MIFLDKNNTNRTMDIQGKHEKYSFYCPLDDEKNRFLNVPAVYAFGKFTSDEWTLLYVGQTNNLAGRFDNHHKGYCIRQHKANVFCFLKELNTAKRLQIENELVRIYRPICNK